MIKVFVITIFVSLAFNLAFAKTMSFEEAIENQLTDEIKPVLYKGAHVLGSDQDAAAICGLLGYLRLVNSEKEPCTKGEKLISPLATANARGGSTAPFFINENDTYECGKPSFNSKRLVSVTCAK